MARQKSLVSRLEKIEVEHKGAPEDCTLLMNKGISTPFNCAMRKYWFQDWQHGWRLNTVWGQSYWMTFVSCVTRPTTYAVILFYGCQIFTNNKAYWFIKKCEIKDVEITVWVIPHYPEVNRIICPTDIHELLMNRTVLATVNGKAWDFHRPLEEDCELRFHHFKEDDPKLVNQVSSTSFIPVYTHPLDILNRSTIYMYINQGSMDVDNQLSYN